MSALQRGQKSQAKLCDTFDFRLRQAIQAVLTHLLFTEAAVGEGLSSLRDLDLLLVLDADSAELSMVLGVEWSDSSSLGSCSLDISSEVE